jgi:hypothetical protein
MWAKNEENDYARNFDNLSDKLAAILAETYNLQR